LKEFPEAWWYDHDPLARGSDTGAGERRAHLHLDQADVIVSFDDDFLLMHPVAVKHAADFAGRRRGGAGQLNRLYVAEAGYTVTGAAADHRCALPSGDIPALIFLLARHLFEGGLAGRERAGLPDALTTFDAPHVDSAFAQALARDVLAHRGRGVIAVGPRQPAAVRYLAYVLNVLLENAGKTVTYTAAPALSQPPPSGGGQPFDTLLILGANPVLTAAPDDPILETIASAGTSIHLGLYADETARLCTWHLPQAHYLESWGDARAWDGTVSLVQPLIEPLYGGRTAIEVLALVLGEEQAQGYELVRRTFREQFARGAWEAEWARALHDGVVPDTAWPVESEPSFGQASERDALAAALADAGRRAEPYELRFVPDAKVCDGRFANNAWLQELPDPITKLTWDNAALIAPADAKKLGVEKYGDVVRIEVAGEGGAAPRSLKLPAYILPGHAEGAITLPLGYGRGASAGVVADGAGFDVNKLRSVASPWIVPRAKVTATGKHYDLATTQDHHAIDSQVGERETEKRVAVLVREVTPAELAHDPEHVKHVVHLPQSEQLWQPKKYEGYKWGMAIDLSACIGCGACAVACQAENNVPVVGKEEVARGREMHWLRVDRYFREGTEGRRDEGTEGRRDGGTEGRRDEGTEGDAHLDPSIPRSLDPSVSIVHQPMMCVHCETAPCEGVCPVAATLHDEDGLNVMVYNRCVGTRYCSNNCPYKVRRFNWFYNHHGPAHPRSVKAGTRPLPGLIKRQDATPIEIMQHNPEVTVRSRGVMEKCTYCVQRINAAKIRFKNEHLQGRYPDWPRIPDGAIVPACAQACPTDTIVFGDLNDPNSRVSKLHAEPRSYGVLAELNTRPRTVYLAKVRNPAKQ
ncbi:MAG: 4Fe-4S dicluster domain-containing protein, partial [Planctomycetota bacterium]